LPAIEVEYGMGRAEHLKAVSIDKGVVAELVAEHDLVFATVQWPGCAAGKQACEQQQGSGANKL
jgi:hypothetical protein